MSRRGTEVGGVRADMLFVGLTRPAMAFGVPYAVLLAAAVMTVEAFLLSGNLLALLISAPLYGLCRLACSAEPRYFELWADWAPRAIRQRLANSAYWSARSLGPFTAAPRPWVRP